MGLAGLKGSCISLVGGAEPELSPRRTALRLRFETGYADGGPEASYHIETGYADDGRVC